MILDYEGVKRALSDHETFSSQVPARPGGQYEVLLDGKVIPDQVTLGELVAERRLPPLSWFDVRWRD